MDLVILFRTILRKIWLLILFPLLAAIIAYALTSNLKKQYLSRSQLATGFTIKDVGNQDFNIMTADVKFNNLIENLLSPQVVSQTGYELMVHELMSDQPYSKGIVLSKPVQDLLKKLGSKNIIEVLEYRIKTSTVLDPNKVIERDVFKILEGYHYDYESIKKVVYVERAGRSDYVNIFAKTYNPEQSAFIVNSLSKNFLQFNNEIRDTRNIGSLDTLKQQVEDKRVYLSKKQKELTDFKTMIGILDLNTSGTSKLDLVSSFEQTLAQEKIVLVQSESELQEVISRLRSLGSLQTNNSSELLSLRKQINDLEASYATNKDATILSTLTELRRRRNELAVSTDIEGLRDDKLKKQELEERASLLRSKISSSRRNIGSLQSRISALNSNVSSYAGKEAEMKALEQEVALAQADYTTVNNRYNDASSLNTSFNTSGIMQSLSGQPAIKPESSKRLIIVVSALLSTFILCFVIIVLMEYFDFSIKTPANFYRATQIKVIGSIPYLNLTNKGKKGELFIDTDLEKVKDKTHLVNLLNKLRYELESTGCRLVLFTSTGNRTGKTTILSLLTSVYSKSNKRVLIIDSNFSNNEITQNIEKDKAQKLLQEGTVVREEPESEGLVYVDKSSRVLSVTNNIDVLGCKPDYYLQSEQYPEHEPLNKFKNLTDTYDYVFIEGPCLNTYTDSKELSKYVDGVVLVSSVQDQIRYIDKESINFLKGLDTKFLGAVLNKVDYRDLL